MSVRVNRPSGSVPDILDKEAALDDTASWERIITNSLLSRLRELVDLSRDCRALSEAIGGGRGALDNRTGRSVPRRAQRPCAIAIVALLCGRRPGPRPRS